MRSQILELRVAGTVFGLMGLAQLCRLIVQPDVQVWGHELPLWPSIVAVIVLGGLSVWMFEASWPHKHGHGPDGTVGN